MAMTTAMSVREQNARRFMAIAATLAVLGVALNLSSEDSTLAKLVAAAGVVTLIWSIHRFGRLGPDEPMVFETPEEAAPKKKKKKKKRAAADETSADPQGSDGAQS
jgi:uncharacterized membrane protein YfcA